MFKKIFGTKSNVDNLNVRTVDYYKISLNLLENITDIMKSELDERRLNIKSIPEKKLNNAMKIYNIDRSRVIALYDTTLFNSGKDGILLATDFIGLKGPFEQANVIKFDELVVSRIDTNEKKLEINNNVINLENDSIKIVLEKIKELLIFHDSHLQSIYKQCVVNKLNILKDSVQNNDIETAEKILNILNGTIVSRNKNYYSYLYYYGCLIKEKQSDFNAAYEYLNKLESLQQFDNEKINSLKNLLDQSKAKYEFNLLENKKNIFIEQNQYENAVNIVNEQRALNIKTEEELNNEIARINKLKQAYIETLEEQLDVKLNNEEYDSIFEILAELDVLNPNHNNSYEEYYLMAKIGMYEFEEVFKRIREIKESNEELASRLENKLIEVREDVTKKIVKAVKEKDYELFKKDENLRYAKDISGMPPIAHFILNKDFKGVKILANTYEYFKFDQNVVGHNILNLINLTEESKYDQFSIDVFKMLDEGFKSAVKKYKATDNVGKAGRWFLDNMDSYNKQQVFDPTVSNFTSTAGRAIDDAIRTNERELENYYSDLANKNYERFILYLLEPINLEEQLQICISNKNEIQNELDELKIEKSNIENSLEDKLKIAVEKKLEGFLYEAAINELGEKDEFETTAEYNKRIKLKIEEIRISYTENNYVKNKISNLEREVKENISRELGNIEENIEGLTFSYDKAETFIDKLYYLLHCKSKIDINDVISGYYDVYKSTIEIGQYNADSEIFYINVNGNERKVKVSRNIARDFKEKFDTLNPTYSRKILGNYTINHYFTYEYKCEKVKILFMTNRIESKDISIDDL